MGKQAKTQKERKCRLCEQSLYATAKELKQHTELCRRAKEAGIILPGIQRPDLVVTRGWDKD